MASLSIHFPCCPPGGTGFKADPALMDFGQASPEDEDLYSTRSWEPDAGEEPPRPAAAAAPSTLTHTQCLTNSTEASFFPPKKFNRSLSSKVVRFTTLKKKKKPKPAVSVAEWIVSETQVSFAGRKAKDPPTTSSRALVHRWQVVFVFPHMCHFCNGRDYGSHRQTLGASIYCNSARSRWEIP